MSEVFGWGIARAFPTAPPPGLLRLVQGDTTKTVGVATSGWGVQNDGGTAAVAVLAVAPADATMSANNFSVSAGAFAAFALTGLVSGSKTVSLTTSTPGASVDPANASKGISFTTAPSPPPSPPPAPQAGAMQFQLLSPTSGTKPFVLCFAFRQGDIPAGQQPVASGATAKAAILNTWPDGSAKLALVGGTYTSTANVAATVTLSAGSVAAGAALTAANLQTAMGANTAVIDCGAFGSAAWSGSDFASPFLTHFAFDQCAEFVYRKPVGSDAHLVAWLAVRLFASGEVEHLPWVENGYLNVAGPTNKSATFTFTLGGTLRETLTIDLPHHSRTPLVSSTRLAHWLGSDPGVTVQHDRLYLASTELVPSWTVQIDATDSKVTGLPGTFTPLQMGSFSYQSDIMSSTGYSSSIGPLPQHDALYLQTSASIGATVERNAYSAGRYPIHWRDSSTNRPPLITSYPNLVIGGSQGVTNTGASGTGSYTPAVSGTAPPQWDMAHCPSVGYLAFLLTGRFYHLETCQFAASLNYLHQSTAERAGGVFRSVPGAIDTRGAAWGFRTLVQALSITPDADSLQKAALKASAEATIDFHHARYVAQANNPLGFVEPGGDYIPDAGVSGDIVFMQDFFTGSWGYALAMDPPVSSTHKTRMQAFFQWNAQQVVGRLGAFGGATSWPYINAVQYRIACAPADTPDYAGGTGPWYSTFKQAYDATYASPPVWLGSTNGTLAGEAAPGNGAAASFWGNIQFSISYAVRHGVSGARDAYVRMASADNWPRLAADFVAAPVWAITPASGLLPSYMQGKAVGEFVAIPNSTLDASNGISGQWAFSNLALAIEEMLQDNSGGHNDGSLNIIRGFNLYTATGWVTRKGSTWAGEANMAYYADGSPAARHTYNTGWYSLARSRLMLHGSPVVAGGGAVSFPDSNGFNLANNTWDANNTWADAPDPGACQDADGNVWCAQGGPTNYIYKWNAVSDTWAQVRYHGGGANRPLTPMSDRPDKGYIFSCAVSGGALVAFKFNAGENTPITFNSSAAYSTYLAEAPENCTMRWDEVNRKFRIFGDKSNKIFEVTPNDTTVWDMAIATSTGATLPAPAAAMGRMAHIPAYRADVFAPGVNQPLYMRRYA